MGEQEMGLMGEGGEGVDDDDGDRR